MSAIKNMHPEAKKNYLKKGFSIIEVMIAIFIISFGLMGVLSLVQQNIKVSRINRTAVVSASLAQEGLELIRKKRDENWLKSLAFDTGLSVGTSTMDYKGYTHAAPNGITDTNAILKINSDGFYEHLNSTNSAYNRIIIITKPTAQSILVTCYVRYRGGVNSYDYIATEILTDWQM
jgi:prepilin-type N-terminal cleavage/methylation domain-containing protein